MIISASRRTDIPAHYTDWFFNRLEEGYVLTRTPMRPHQVSKISLKPDVVDGFVFWTKNPLPMMPRLSLLDGIPYYFQFTLTAYGKNLEPGIPSKRDVLIPAFQNLARTIGSDRLVWRYDPIILTPSYSIEYHLHYFSQLAKALEGTTDTCVISFFDSYRHLKHAIHSNCLSAPDQIQIMELAARMQDLAHKRGFRLTTCSESMDLSNYGIYHSSCIDGQRLSRIAGFSLHVNRDANQRSACCCDSSVDIGMYDSCGNHCLYCYANHSEKLVNEHLMKHDPRGPLLYGTLSPEDTITERSMRSLRSDQISLF